MDERLAVARTGGKCARARVLEALDNRRLAAAVRPDDHRQGRVELDHLSSEPGPSVLQKGILSFRPDGMEVLT